MRLFGRIRSRKMSLTFKGGLNIVTYTCHNIFYHGKLTTLRWRHDEHDSVSNHQPHDCLLNRLFRRSSEKTSKLRVTGLCAGNSSGTGEFSAQMASNAENVSIWWRHHVIWTNILHYPMISVGSCLWPATAGYRLVVSPIWRHQHEV